MARKKKEDFFDLVSQRFTKYKRQKPKNKAWGVVMDCFDNLGYETKDGKKPLLLEKEVKSYGMYLRLHLPPGISYKQVIKDRDFFETATAKEVEITWKNGCVHMSIQDPLPTNVLYEWDPEPYKKMILPFPVGWDHTKLIADDLSRKPHLLIGGATNFGKTNFLRGLIAALLPMAYIVLIDLKGVDFPYLEGHVGMMVEEPVEVAEILQMLNDEHDRRKRILRANKAVKIQNYKSNYKSDYKSNDKGDDLPYIVCIIDEVAEVDKKDIHYINRLVRLSRAMGIHIVAATQRPSVQVLDGDTRSQFMGRLCFPVASEIDSRMILGEEHSDAAWLPSVEGIALYKTGRELKKVQTMFLDDKVAEKMLLDIPARRWGEVEFSSPVKQSKQPAKKEYKLLRPRQKNSPND